MTQAADRFTDAIDKYWDSPAPWQNTADRGLAAVDAEELAALCRESGDDYAEAEAEVLAYVRGRVANAV